MSVFTGRLRIEEVKPGRLWRLLDPIRYEAGAESSGCWIEVPAGFVTDGATLPPFLRLFLAVWGSYGRAAALHDYLYACLRDGRPHPEAPTRSAADAEFRLAMKACGTHPVLAWAMWAAVRFFGASAAKGITKP